MRGPYVTVFLGPRALSFRYQGRSRPVCWPLWPCLPTICPIVGFHSLYQSIPSKLNINGFNSINKFLRGLTCKKRRGYESSLLLTCMLSLKDTFTFISCFKSQTSQRKLLREGGVFEGWVFVKGGVREGGLGSELGDPLAFGPSLKKLFNFKPLSTRPSIRFHAMRKPRLKIRFRGLS